MGTKATRILLMEDNPGDARLIREMLVKAEGYDFDITWVTRLSQGLESLSRGDADVVLLDLGLPDSRGLDTFVQAYAHSPSMPFVILTGLADETIALTAVGLGAQDYLVKGDMADGTLLIKSVRYAMERKRVEEALNAERQKLKESQENLRWLASKLITAQEQERQRISRELHDELGQNLCLLKFRVKEIQKELGEGNPALGENCQEVLAQLDQVVESVRRLSYDLSPPELKAVGLSGALQALFRDFRRHNHQDVQILRLDDLDTFLSREDQINIFRIFQESLTNISKHAQATRITVEIKREGNRASLMIADNGKGFSTEQNYTDAERHGIGLASMDERVRMLGGSLTVESKKNKGTKITFEIPLRNA
ncbi:MAG: histidine kinase [Deltaproteobacteria bacterium]|nr:histidine kinase [Deltaproteobacteria bacterium]